MKKNLEQLKKDYDQLGKTIAELDKPTILYWPDLFAGTFFYFTDINGGEVVFGFGKYNIAIRDDSDGYTYLEDGTRWDMKSSVRIHRPVEVISCDINANHSVHNYCNGIRLT